MNSAASVTRWIAKGDHVILTAAVRKNLGAGGLVANAFTLGELTLRSMNVAKEVELLEKSLVFPNIDNDCRAVASLREDESAAGLLHVLDELGSMGPELGYGPDVVL